MEKQRKVYTCSRQCPPEIRAVVWQGAAAGGVYHEAARPEAEGAGARDCAAPVLALRPRHAGARVPRGRRALRVGECHDLEQAATRALKVSTVIFTIQIL